MLLSQNSGVIFLKQSKLQPWIFWKIKSQDKSRWAWPFWQIDTNLLDTALTLLRSHLVEDYCKSMYATLGTGKKLHFQKVSIPFCLIGGANPFGC